MGPGWVLWVPPARSGRERERQRHGAHPPTPTRARGAPPGGTLGGSPLRGGPQLRFWTLTLEKSGASLSDAAAGALRRGCPRASGGRMAAACRCLRCAARQPERRRPPRSFSFRRIIREYCQNTARKEKIRGYVRYRLPSVPISALARRGTAVFSQGSLPRTAAAPRAAHGAEEHPQLCVPFPAAAATRGPPPPFHRAAPSGRPAQRCRRPTALPPTAPPLPPFGPE